MLYASRAAWSTSTAILRIPTTSARASSGSLHRNLSGRVGARHLPVQEGGGHASTCSPRCSHPNSLRCHHKSSRRPFDTIIHQVHEGIFQRFPRVRELVRREPRVALIIKIDREGFQSVTSTASGRTCVPQSAIATRYIFARSRASPTRPSSRRSGPVGDQVIQGRDAFALDFAAAWRSR